VSLLIILFASRIVPAPRPWDKSGLWLQPVLNGAAERQLPAVAVAID
jgi:hypothetical protein